MSRFLDAIAEDPVNLVKPATYAPVDPDAGSQGASCDALGSHLPFVGQTIQHAVDLGHGFAQEGLRGLLDYSGMLDRQAAQRELASRFNVIPDGTPGMRSQNQVSESQYEAIARQYSDIRLGRTDIEIDPTALPDGQSMQQYRTDLMELLANQLQTESGRTLISGLAENRHVTTFGPLFGEDDQLDNTNAVTSLVDDKGRSRKTTDRAVGRNKAGAPGKGYDAIIALNPGAEFIGVDNVVEQRPDVALYHEMMHAYTHTHGITARGDVRAGDAPATGPALTNEQQVNVDFDAILGTGRREHQAAGLGRFANESLSENAYRRERSEIGWRGVGVQPGDHAMPAREAYTPSSLLAYLLTKRVLE